MPDSDRPIFYYLYPDGDDFKIERHTDEEAAKLWDQGRKFVDMGQKSKEEAEALRPVWLNERLTS